MTSGIQLSGAVWQFILTYSVNTSLRNWKNANSDNTALKELVLLLCFHFLLSY